MIQKTILVLPFLFAYLLIAGCGDSGSTDTGDPPSTVQYLFVQTADSGTFEQSSNDPDIYILTLKGVKPTTTYFSDRPYRLAGYITTSDFTDSWNDTTDDSFLRDPPNAALQIDDAAASADVLIVELVDVLYEQGSDTVKYRTRIVNLSKDSIELFHARKDPAANFPASFGAASLFIDSWYSKAWHKVKKTVDDTVKKEVDTAADKLKRAVSGFEKAVTDTGQALDDLAKDPSKMLDMTDDAFLQLISIALPSGLGACLDVVPESPIFDLFDKPSTDNADWMATLPGTIELKRLAMPGSHDTGTYPINGLSPLGTELAQGNNEYARLFIALSTVKKYFPVDYPVTEQFAGWSRAQGHTIKAQLEAGVRYFDLRMLPDAKNEKFHATHVLLGAEIEPMLSDVAGFLAKHPKEIVILDFQHLFSNVGDDGGMEMLVAGDLVDKLTFHFNTKLVTAAKIADPNTATLTDFWNNNVQVLALFDTNPYDNLSFDKKQNVWDADVVLQKRYWPQQTSWFGTFSEKGAKEIGILQYLNENIGKADTFDKISVIQGQMTPTIPLIGTRVALALTVGTVKAQENCLRATSGIADDLISGIANHLEKLTKINAALSLQEAARNYNPELKNWVQQHKPKHIVIADFMVDYPELIKAIIDANR